MSRPLSLSLIVVLLALVAPATAPGATLSLARAEREAKRVGTGLPLDAPVSVGRCVRRSSRSIDCVVRKERSTLVGATRVRQVASGVVVVRRGRTLRARLTRVRAPAALPPAATAPRPPGLPPAASGGSPASTSLRDAIAASAFVADATVAGVQPAEPLHAAGGAAGELDIELARELVTFRTAASVRGEAPVEFSVVVMSPSPFVAGLRALVFATDVKGDGYRYLATAEGALRISAADRIATVRATEVGRTLDGLTVEEARERLR